MVDAERLEIAGDFNHKHLWYVTCIFEDNSESRLLLWAVHNYKEVTGSIKKLHVCDIDVISPEELITYESLVQETTHEYCNLVN